MSLLQKQRRVVLLAGGDTTATLAGLFAQPSLASWVVAVADGPEHARFLADLDACDVLLIDESGLDVPADADLGWVFARSKSTVIFLSAVRPELVHQALARGARLWLPRDLVLADPSVLADALAHALRSRAEHYQMRHSRRQLLRCRAQVARLADLIWNSLPVEGRPGWLTQHHMLERLQEEVLRSDRHGSPLSLVLGEWVVSPRASTATVAEVEQRLRAWTAERVLHNKRRTDVAGQYGLRGFMLLLPHTSAEGAQEYCRRLRAELEELPPGLPASWRLHASFGIAGYSGAHRTPKSLLRLAEEQLSPVSVPARSSAPPPRIS